MSSKLSRHVVKKRNELLEGVNTVTVVEDDLKAAFQLTKGSRQSLRTAAEEVQRNMRVVGQTRRKQAYMELMEVCMKIKRATSLQQSLKWVRGVAACQAVGGRVVLPIPSLPWP